MTSDNEEDDGVHVNISRKQREEDDFSYENDEPKTRKKTAKNHRKKPQKLTSTNSGKAKKGEDALDSEDNFEDDFEAGEELNMTPASSHNPSEDEGDDQTPVKPARKGKAVKKTTTGLPKR